ncbi:MAG: hypothetical protein PHY28_02015 [Dehalococcoidales bacterium]|nr:hypothetical protein [Dehalococcoidales bacterium]
MKKRTLFISLILAIVLSTLMPATALAAKPATFSANGMVSYISPGTVFPAGNSGRWVVAERELIGALAGDISGGFTMTYKANVESLETQAGNFHGTLIMDDGSYSFNVNGRSEPLQFVQWIEFPPQSGNYVPLMLLTISGDWTLTEGAQGHGNFDAQVLFIPTLEGHVGYIVNSSFNMAGQWKP